MTTPASNVAYWVSETATLQALQQRSRMYYLAPPIANNERAINFLKGANLVYQPNGTIDPSASSLNIIDMSYDRPVIDDNGRIFTYSGIYGAEMVGSNVYGKQVYDSISHNLSCSNLVASCNIVALSNVYALYAVYTSNLSAVNQVVCSNVKTQYAFTSNMDVIRTLTCSNIIGDGSGLTNIPNLSGWTTNPSSIISDGTKTTFINGQTYMYSTLNMTCPVNVTDAQIIRMVSNNGSGFGGRAMAHYDDDILRINPERNFSSTIVNNDLTVLSNVFINNRAHLSNQTYIYSTLHLTEPANVAAGQIMRLVSNNNIGGQAIAHYNDDILRINPQREFIGTIIDNDCTLNSNVTCSSTLTVGTASLLQRFNLLGNAYINGNVGVGTGTPRRNLDVNGDAIFATNVGIGTNISPVNLYVDGVARIMDELQCYGGITQCLAIFEHRTTSDYQITTVTDWFRRPLATTVINTITGVSLSSNLVTLPVGKWLILGMASCFRSGRSAVAIRTSTGTIIGVPTCAFQGTGADYAGDVIWNCAVRTITAGTEQIELASRFTNNIAGNGGLVHPAGQNTCHARLIILAIN